MTFVWPKRAGEGKTKTKKNIAKAKVEQHHTTNGAEMGNGNHIVL